MSTVELDIIKSTFGEMQLRKDFIFKELGNKCDTRVIGQNLRLKKVQKVDRKSYLLNLLSIMNDYDSHREFYKDN